MKRPLIILTGPTAVGKTELSLALAKQVQGSILSADSMQVYRHMDIGSAKIRPEEMQGIPHYLIDELEPEEEFQVVKFQEYAKKYMEEIYAQGRIPILTGGTGFYIQALLYDIDFTEEQQDTACRKELEEYAKVNGSRRLHQRLEAVDEKSAAAIHPNNEKRVIRALEFYLLSGKKISEHNEQQRQKESPYQYAYFVLDEERSRLYERIDQRVDQMVEQGLVEEVAQLKKMGCHKGMVSMQGLGYKEVLEYLEGDCSLQEAIFCIKRDTRHFAKRQLTWFRRERDVIWIEKQAFQYDKDRMLAYMLSELEKRKILIRKEETQRGDDVSGIGN